jgi:hypothetical protein
MIVEHVTSHETWFFHAPIAVLIPHSIGDDESMTERLKRYLAYVGIGALIFYSVLILECTIGIKQSIKKLINALK